MLPNVNYEELGRILLLHRKEMEQAQLKLFLTDMTIGSATLLPLLQVLQVTSRLSSFVRTWSLPSFFFVAQQTTNKSNQLPWQTISSSYHTITSATQLCSQLQV